MGKKIALFHHFCDTAIKYIAIVPLFDMIRGYAIGMR